MWNFQLDTKQSIERMAQTQLKIQNCYQTGLTKRGAGAVAVSRDWQWEYNPFQGWHRRQLVRYETREQLQRFKNTPVKVYSTDEVFCIEPPSRKYNLLQIIDYYQGSGVIISFEVIYPFFLSVPYWRVLFVRVRQLTEFNYQEYIAVYEILAKAMKGK